MANELAKLSKDLAGVVEQAGRAAVAVHARPRFSSSGIFWKPGIIVTAEHAIRREEEITVTLPDGKSAPATLAGSDQSTDIAILKVEAEGVVLPSVAAPVPGNLALTVGRSADSGVNATLGAISAVSGSWRTWRGGRLDHYIRLDLTLYPQSTGAVVVDVEGRAIGIATPALSRIAGVAIPSNTLNRVVDELLARGQVARGYLGVGLQPVELPDHQKGLIILSLGENGPAAKAGVLVGDILVSLNLVAVAEPEDVQNIVESNAVGTKLTAGVVRGGVARSIEVAIGERPRSN
ncbi:MAG TPA: trypsin-like peptidase domain-containing protein [Verrucomicrobiae bacterium]|nr:trypsin-like peptidase domain-containing protein [Verrucomicrobiae bacterium]